MTSIVRQSKYRHIFGTEAKLQFQYIEMRPYVSAWDSNFVSASSQYFAFPWSSGGGSVCCFKYNQTGKQKTPHLLDAHTSKIQDLDFSPYNPYLLATCAMDTEVRVWSLPKDGLTQTIKESTVTLVGHDKKVGIVKFHPTAANALTSVGSDNLIKVWDVEAGVEKFSMEQKQTPHSIDYNMNGSLMATTCKDKMLRILDIRSGTTTVEVESHQGTKGSRCLWFPKHDKIFTVGSTKLSERQFMLWDPRNMKESIAEQVIDVGAGLMMPFYDEDTSMLYLAGKGDISIRYFEVVPDAPYFHYVETFRGAKAQIGMAMVPKYGLDTSVCETTRLLKLTADSIIPCSFQVPRKSSQFQDDIYPDTRSPNPPMTAEEWAGGKDADPILMSLNPKKNKDLQAQLIPTDFKTTQIKEAPAPKMPEKVTDPKRLTEQNDAFRDRVVKLEKAKYDLEEQVRELKKQLAALGGKVEEEVVHEEKVSE
jgi:coronin-1B/1C/6